MYLRVLKHDFYNWFCFIFQLLNWMWHSVSSHFYFLNKTQINLVFCLFCSEFDEYKQLHKYGHDTLIKYT